MALSLRKLSSTVFRKPSRVVSEINANARLIDWCKRNPAETSCADRRSLYSLVSSRHEGEAIDYVEFGVYEGGSFRLWLGLNSHPDSRFFGFDTFEGLPEDWAHVRGTMQKGTFDVGGTPPVVDSDRAEFIKGLFQDTLSPFLSTFSPKGSLVIHNDSDLYSSTLYCLAKCDELLVAGSIVIFDEFHSAANEFQAFHDYVRAFCRNFRVIGAVGWPYRQVAIEML